MEDQCESSIGHEFVIEGFGGFQPSLLLVKLPTPYQHGLSGYHHPLHGHRRVHLNEQRGGASTRHDLPEPVSMEKYE